MAALSEEGSSLLSAAAIVRVFDSSVASLSFLRSLPLSLLFRFFTDAREQRNGPRVYSSSEEREMGRARGGR